MSLNVEKLLNFIKSVLFSQKLIGKRKYFASEGKFFLHFGRFFAAEPALGAFTL